MADREQVAAMWHTDVTLLKKVNPQLDLETKGGSRDINIPLDGILRTDPCEGCVPVYHLVKQSEGLFRIGQWYGKIKAPALKELNGLKSDALKPGQQLLVGYVKVPAPTLRQPDPVVAAKEDTVAFAGPAGEPDTVDTAGEKGGPQDTLLTEKRPEWELTYEGNGFFENEWVLHSADTARRTGKASTFKTESGWADGRFYLLHSQLKTGTVVRLTHAGNGRSVYAKVVGPLPAIRQNAGIQMRMNQAAAVSLGMQDELEVFEVVLEY
ncbi:MAG TPA: LysM peptidoglycan-binding domain-containing protein [Phnomibacter sp.]|nr:LysM peptidoglycan-binding domain-containing protein [Phnomibacter sp.]